MVLANGFISKDESEVINELNNMIKGSCISPIPLPYKADTMTYYISNIGECFGSQKYENFYLTKPLKIEKRYKKGCHIRIACGNKIYKNEYIQNLMYYTFITKQYVENITLSFLDNNQYNYQLDNICIKQNNGNEIERKNIELLCDAYKRYFSNVVWYVKFIDNQISLEDAKDIVSDAFFEICKTPYNYDKDYFIGLWKSQVKKRALDFILYNSKFENLYDWIEIPYSENFLSCIDYKKNIKGSKTLKIFELWLQNESNNEIAKIMNISPTTVRCCITRSLQKLKKAYRKDILICK